MNPAGICEASAATIARWLAEDALKPWQHRSWIFATDPAFLEKAGPVLDLYQGRWQGKLLHPGVFVICADEKPSIQARRHIHETLRRLRASAASASSTPTGAGERSPTWPRTTSAAAAADAHNVFGRSEPRGGIASFDRLVRQVMTKEPYASARRVFWIVDNSSSHRGQKALDRLQQRWSNLILVHLPVHATWLNQIEIYYSILQRKSARAQRLRQPRRPRRPRPHTQRVRRPLERDRRTFDWHFTRDDLAALIERLAAQEPQFQLAA